MKKLIGILGVVVIAMAMFFSANPINSSNIDLNLADLITMNTANAEVPGQDTCGPNSIQDRFADHEMCQTYIPFVGEVRGQKVECHNMTTQCCTPYSCRLTI